MLDAVRNKLVNKTCLVVTFLLWRKEKVKLYKVDLVSQVDIERLGMTWMWCDMGTTSKQTQHKKGGHVLSTINFIVIATRQYLLQQSIYLQQITSWYTYLCVRNKQSYCGVFTLKCHLYNLDWITLLVFNGIDIIDKRNINWIFKFNVITRFTMAQFYLNHCKNCDQCYFPLKVEGFITVSLL